MYGIYCIENMLDGKRYIGKSKNAVARLAAHKSSLIKDGYSRNTNRLVFNAVKKYGFENFHFGIIECVANDDFVLSERELYWIDWYNSCNRDFGYNLLRQSGGVTTHSEDTKKILSILSKGTKQTPEHIKARTSKLIGVKHTSERTEKIRAKLVGYKHSAETIAKRSATMRGRKQTEAHVSARIESKALYSYEQYTMSGELVNTFLRLRDLKAAGFNQGAVSAVVRGKANMHRGFVWKAIPKNKLI